MIEQAKTAYLTGQATFSIAAARSALLVIDMQDEFLRPQWSPMWVPAATRMIPRVRELIEGCRNADIPVIWTIFDHTHQRRDRPHALRHLPHAHTDWQAPLHSRISDELGYLDDEIVIRKPSYGAFYDTPLDTILRNLGRDTVIIAGTLTNYCCGTTARQAYERGYHVVFGSDVTATDDESRQEDELAVLRKGFALVTSAADILTRLEPRDAGHQCPDAAPRRC